jgi:hypothetical protein
MIKKGYVFSSSLAAFFYATAALAGSAAGPNELEVTVLPIIGTAAGVELAYGRALTDHTELLVGVGYAPIDLYVEAVWGGDNNSKGIARAKGGVRYDFSGDGRGLYVQGEVAYHVNRFEVYRYETAGRPWRGWVTVEKGSAVPAAVVGWRWVFADRLSLRLGGGIGGNIPWDVSEVGDEPDLAPAFPRLDGILGITF